MALLDLNLIAQLVSTAHLREVLAVNFCYAPKVKTLSDEDFVRYIRMGKQGKNLLDQLLNVRQICEDYSTGNFEPYITKHYESFKRLSVLPTDEPFNAWDDLEYIFTTETNDRLPKAIQEYTDLVDLANSYALLKENESNQLKKFFPNAKTYYRAQNEDGSEVMLSADEMDPTLVNQLEATQQVKHVDVEYCLDGYNQFMSECERLIALYANRNDIQTCCLEILKMYAPLKKYRTF